MGLKKVKQESIHENVRIRRGTHQKSLLKKFITQITAAMLALVVVYLAFASVLVRVVFSDAGPVMVKENTWKGGQIPPHSRVLIKLDPNPLDEDKVVVKHGIVDNLTQAFVPQKPSAIVEVIAGPSGKIKIMPGGIVALDGTPLAVKMSKESFYNDAEVGKDPELYLVDQYIAICISGACNGPLLFDRDQIIGVPVLKTESSIE